MKIHKIYLTRTQIKTLLTCMSAHDDEGRYMYCHAENKTQSKEHDKVKKYLTETLYNKKLDNMP